MFRNHIQIKHQLENNCNECDFQAGPSQIILSKHMNLRHRKESEKTNDTLKCDECDSEFSVNWNLNNHKRDKHEQKEECSFYKKGACRFPDNVCWKIHKKVLVITASNTEDSSNECFICKNNFKNKNEMMLHRKEVHPEKVRLCNNPINCGLKTCWYRHKENEGVSQIENKLIQEVVSKSFGRLHCKENLHYTK